MRRAVVAAAIAVALIGSLLLPPAARLLAARMPASGPVSVSYVSGTDVIAVSTTGTRQPNGSVIANITITSEKAIAYVLGFDVRGSVTAPWWRHGASIASFEVPLLGGVHITLASLVFSRGSRLTITADKWAKYVHGWMTPAFPMGVDYIDAFVRCTTGSSLGDFMNHGMVNEAGWDLGQALAAGLDSLGMGGAAIGAFLARPNKDWKGAFGALLTTTSSHPKAFGQLLKNVFHISLTRAQLGRFVAAAPLLGCVISLPDFAFDLSTAPQLRRVAVTALQGQHQPTRRNGLPTAGIQLASISCNGRVAHGAMHPPFLVSSVKISIGSSRRRLPRLYPLDDLVGFALYRTWAQPHWLQVEQWDYDTMVTVGRCKAPWGETGDQAGFDYTPDRAMPSDEPPAGEYYLVLLWKATHTDRPPFHSLVAQLSKRTFRLPAQRAIGLFSFYGATGRLFPGVFDLSLQAGT